MNNNQGRRRTRRVRQQRKQKNTQISRILLTICMMALVAVVSIGGTMAWLQDTTDSINNTFTTSNVDIILTETDADNDNDALNNKYKMIPGVEFAKDPKVTVVKGSEKCYVYVKIEKSKNFEDFFETYEMGEDWQELDNPGVDAEVWYQAVAGTSADGVLEADKTMEVISGSKLTVKDEITNSEMVSLTAETYPTFNVTAYAIQQASVADPATGWNNVKDLDSADKFEPTNP